MQNPNDCRPFEPFGAALELLKFTGDEAVASGPAGTGKSRACLEKLYAIAEAFPGCRLLICRKTRESVSESALVTWEQEVVPEGHPAITPLQRRNRQAYEFPNGSVVNVGGLDKPSKILSTQYDVIYVQEAIELSETDWETLTTRLRHGKVPYQQIIADTNPDGPQHWIYQRSKRGGLRLIESRHEDNPTVWDRAANAPTPNGARYLAKLDALTGVRKDRFRYGRWVQAEGVVYDGYDAAIHLVTRAALPTGWRTWKRYWAVDFGYTNPFVWQEWAEDGDGRLYLLQEIYHTRRLVEDHAKTILAATKLQVTGGRLTPKFPDSSPLPVAVVCDHDAEDRATLERHLGIRTIAAYKSVSPGIQAVATRLKLVPEGEPGAKPRLYLVRDALVETDTELEKAKKPTCTAEEIGGYVWDTGAGRKRGEEPVKDGDHGQDAKRYLVAYVDKIKNNGRVIAFVPL